ncbi:FkbM family methyltransferase [Paucidesulfovibrio gracilis]|nr:FkbM family methyltransferase [Paucidesulfovibrio gracilis]
MCDQPEMATVHGIRLLLNDEYLSPKMRSVLEKGAYEDNEVRILKETLVSDDSYLELGAGIGVTAIIAAQRLDKAPVLYEANPVLCKYLERNSRINGVELEINNGVVAHGKSKDFYIHENFWSSSLLYKEGTVQTVSVAAHTMQSLLMQYQPSYLLCDIEGGEVEAFADADLTCLRTICLEIHNHYVGDYQTTQTIAKIVEQGFAIDFQRSAGKVFLFYRP